MSQYREQDYDITVTAVTVTCLILENRFNPVAFRREVQGDQSREAFYEHSSSLQKAG